MQFLETDIQIVTYKDCTALIRGERRQIFTGGRVACKREAKRLHETTGCRVFNVKKSGNIVEIYPAKEKQEKACTNQNPV